MRFALCWKVDEPNSNRVGDFALAQLLFNLLLLLPLDAFLSASKPQGCPEPKKYSHLLGSIIPVKLKSWPLTKMAAYWLGMSCETTT